MFISPMLLHKVDQPFDDKDWISELKLDGFRTIWTKYDDKVKIYTRHNNEITANFPELHHLDVPDGTVLDGEIIVSDDNGKPDFEAVMERFRSKKSQHDISFSVFDVLHYNKKCITDLPLLNRKEILNDIIPEDTPLFNQVKWIQGAGVDYFKLTQLHELEGIVLKKANSRYQVDKRSHDWLKVINYQYEDVYITGCRKGEFGLVLTFLDGRYAGIMEFVPPQERKTLYKSMERISETDKYVYINPIKCKVKYRNLTKKGLLRIPSFHEWS